MRALLVAICLLMGINSEAAAYACKDLTETTLVGIPFHWPDAKFFIYKSKDAQAIERGLRDTGIKVVSADREFVVVTRPRWDKVRIIGFIDGCYEAFVDIPRGQLDDWLAGKGAQK